MNAGARKYSNRTDWPYRELKFEDPESKQALQVVDILIGAIAYRLNGHYEKPEANAAKRALCDHVLKWAKITNPSGEAEGAGCAAAYEAAKAVVAKRATRNRALSRLCRGKSLFIRAMISRSIALASTRSGQPVGHLVRAIATVICRAVKV
jgi:hypothetical protein